MGHREGRAFRVEETAREAAKKRSTEHLWGIERTGVW